VAISPLTMPTPPFLVPNHSGSAPAGRLHP
jgi:hypothetical protein